MTTAQVVALHRNIHEWCCGVVGCGFRMGVKLDQVDAISWLIVRHLIRVHGMSATEIVECDPCLASEVRVYCAQFHLS